MKLKKFSFSAGLYKQQFKKEVMSMPYDFEGWATKNDLECADGLTIKKDAFRVNDGKTVPLVWNHQHNKVADVL